MEFYDNSHIKDNGRIGAQMIRESLDRVVCNVGWRLAHPKAAISHLVCGVLDHVPILLDSGFDKDNLPRPFKFIST